MNSIYKVLFNIYILFWVLYNFHWQNVGLFFPLFDRFSNVFLGINLLISIICVVIVLTKERQSLFFRIVNMLLFSFFVYGMISILVDEPIYIKAIGSGERIKNATYLVSVLRTFSPIYTCYLFTIIGCVNVKVLKIWFWAFLLQSILTYFLIRTSFGLTSLDEMRTNNTGYLFTAIFPLISLYNKNTKIQYVLIVLFLVLTIISIKRGAILILLLEILYFFSYKFKEGNNYSKLRIILLLSLLICFVYLGIEYLNSNNSVFQDRFEKTLEGNVSGRDYIIKSLLDVYLNSNYFNLLFGYGADSTLRLSINYAHNDWIELLINQGLMGFVLFLLFWIAFYRIWKMETKKQSSIALLLGLLFICSFSKTFFSMWYSMTSIYVTLPLGYCLAKIKKSKEKHSFI